MYDIVCQTCGTHFQDSHTYTRFCSRKCYGQWWHKTHLPPKRQCFRCGSVKTYIDKMGHHKWFKDPRDRTKYTCALCHDKIVKPRHPRIIKDFSKHECYSCGSKKTRILNGKPIWTYNHDVGDSVLCDRCWGNLKNIRKYDTPTERAKAVSKQMTGKKHSEETKRKLSEIKASQGMFVYPFATSIELKLQDALKTLGISFQTYKPLYGHPDIFIEPNICIFADGDFWHANPQKYPPDRIISKKYTSAEIWEKDARVTIRLQLMGYKVLRFWEDDINKRLDWCISEILKAVPMPITSLRKK